jgi:hypothetical protein
METKNIFIKTMADWENSGMDLGKFLQFGDMVDDEIYDYMLGVLPPVVNKSYILLMGEPVRHNVKGQAYYSALIKGEFSWVYAGLMTKEQASNEQVIKNLCKFAFQEMKGL